MNINGITHESQGRRLPAAISGSRQFRGVCLFLLVLTVAMVNAPHAATGQEPRAPLGHPFELNATTGATVTDRSFPGKWLLVYFGYTQCPDACPTTLLEIGTTLRHLGPAASALQPLFITVDPKHDTQAVLAAYVANFDRRIIGLTGDEAHIAQAKRAFSIWSAERESGDGQYAISHSSLMFIVDPDDGSVEVVPAQIRAPNLVRELHRLMHERPLDISFFDRNGKPLSLRQWRGHPVVLNIWASWCGPCRQELPGLDRLQAQRGGRELQVVAVATDRAGLPAVLPALRTARTRHLRCYVDPSGDSTTTLGIEALPTTLLIDRTGHELYRWQGPVDGSIQELQTMIDQIQTPRAQPLARPILSTVRP